MEEIAGLRSPSLSRVIAPGTRIARPGPGNGWRLASSCDLMVTDGPPANDTLSITSEYRMPSARGSCAAKAPASVRFDASQPGWSPGASCPVRAT